METEPTIEAYKLKHDKEKFRQHLDDEQIIANEGGFTLFPLFRKLPIPYDYLGNKDKDYVRPMIIEKILENCKEIKAYGRPGLYLSEVKPENLVNFFDRYGKIRVVIPDEFYKEQEKISKLKEIAKCYPFNIQIFEITSIDRDRLLSLHHKSYNPYYFLLTDSNHALFEVDGKFKTKWGKEDCESENSRLAIFNLKLFLGKRGKKDLESAFENLWTGLLKRN